MLGKNILMCVKKPHEMVIETKIDTQYRHPSHFSYKHEEWIKGILIHIWKNWHPENFTFGILRFLVLSTRNVYLFLKKVGYVLTNCIVFLQIFCVSKVHISHKAEGFTMWNLSHTTFIWRRIYWQIFISTFMKTSATYI